MNKHKDPAQSVGETGIYQTMQIHRMIYMYTHGAGMQHRLEAGFAMSRSNYDVYHLSVIVIH